MGASLAADFATETTEATEDTEGEEKSGFATDENQMGTDKRRLGIFISVHLIDICGDISSGLFFLFPAAFPLPRGAIVPAIAALFDSVMPAVRAEVRGAESTESGRRAL